MKAIKQFFGGLILCAVEIAVGILLLINPLSFTSGIIIAAGVLMVLCGIGSVIRYFRTEPEAAAASQNLMTGLILLLAGGFCVCKSHWLITVFPVLTVIYGVVILLSGIGKIQWAVDLARSRKGKWFLAAISAVVSIVCAGVILGNPFTTTAMLWMFTGICLICEAVIDIITFLVSGSAKKEAPQQEETV